MGKITITIDNIVQTDTNGNYFTKHLNVKRFTNYVVNKIKDDPLFEHTVMNVTKCKDEYNLKMCLPGAV